MQDTLKRSSIDPVAISSSLNWFQENMLWLIVLLLVGTVVVFTVILPLFRKMKRKQLKVQETNEIKKDLMIWHHLTQLVRGGNAHQKAKQMLSEHILRIEALFKQGLNMLAMHNRKPNDLPWFVIVGEPRSGKSSLLRNSELELIPSAEEDPQIAEDKKSLPLRMWLGAKAVVCDVGGYIFFDRWLNGSSAEWSYIVKLLRRKHYKKPLDGIIITIPADALLADDPNLTQQKAMLMTTEIGQLLSGIGMHLPCSVVITKTDMVDGFRQYVMGINDDLRTQIFGWVNDDANGAYDEKKFKEFFESLINRLQAGCEKNMLSKNVATKLSALSNRMEITGKIYLFPENFNKLYLNLSVYLRALFGEGHFHGIDNSTLEGIFFTSAKEGDVTLSPSFATLSEKSIDEAVIINPVALNTRPYFIRDLFNKLIFCFSPNATFTRKEQIKRNIPKYGICFLMCLAGSFWLFTALFKSVYLERSLLSATDYYASLASVLKNNVVFNAPLIKKTPEGKYVLNNDPLPSENASSRMQFYFEAYSQRESHTTAPFGFGLSSLIVFGNEPDMGYDDKAFIMDQLHGILVRTPILKSVGDKLISDGSDVVLDTNRRAVINSFALLDNVKNEDFTALFTSGDFEIRPMIRYLMPSISADTIELLDSFLPKYDRKHTLTIDPTFIHSENFIKAQNTALQSIISSWNYLNAYPEDLYSRVRNTILTAEKLEKSYVKMNDEVDSLSTVTSVQELHSLIDTWDALVESQKELSTGLTHTMMNLENVFPSTSKALKMGSLAREKPSENRSYINKAKAIDALLRSSVLGYKKLFEKDFDLVEKQTARHTSGSIWGASKEEKQIKETKTKILKNLSDETNKLQFSVTALGENPLYQWVYFEQPHLSDYAITIFGNILTKATVLKTPNVSDLEKNDFKVNWSKSQRNIKEAFEQYDAYVKPYAENQQFTNFINDTRRILTAKATLNSLMIIDVALKKLPTTQAEALSFVAQHSTGQNIFDISDLMAQETLGNLHYNKSFEPKTAKNLFEDLLLATKPFLNKDVSDIFSTTFVEEYSQFNHLMSVFENYLEQYVYYWGTYPEEVYVPATSWQEFKERATSLKAYKINSMLQLIYSRNLDILKNTQGSLLSEAVSKEKSHYISLLTDHLSLLTPLFTEACNRSLMAWSQLPESSQAAWTKLNSLSDQELKNTFLSVYSDKQRSRIAWWNNFVDNGFNLLKRENEQQLQTHFTTQLAQMQTLPLCKNCTSKSIPTFKQMKEIATLLSSMGAKTSNVTEMPKTGILDTQISLFPDTASQDFASEVLTLADSLTNEKKPLIWTLYQPSIETQNALNTKKDVLAVNRFRYIEVSTQTNKNAMRYGTSSTKETSIAQGKASDKKIVLNFFKLSNDTTAEARIVFDNAWAIFKIYLNNGGIFDAQTKQTYIPLYVKDKSGERFVYFVSVKFNFDILTPSEWPTKKTWSLFNIRKETIVLPETSQEPEEL